MNLCESKTLVVHLLARLKQPTKDPRPKL